VTDYLASLLMFGAIYALLALGLNLQWGHTGLVNLGFVAFFAIGAYAAALLTLNGVPFALATAVAIAVAGLAAYPVGRITLRLQDDYFVIVTFGFAEVVRIAIVNTPWVGGSEGLTGILPLFGQVSDAIRPYVQLAMVGAIVAIVLLLAHRLTESPYGRVLRAIRDSALAARSLGKPAQRYRLVALVLGSATAGLAGAIYAHYIGFLSPDQFDPSLTFLVFTGVVIGGSSHWGAALGTLVFIGVMESTRFLSDYGLPISQASFAQIRLMIIGLVLITLMQFRRQGLWPYRHRHRIERQRDAPA
jgi:branched-chain amino acid transport system permease protein